MNTVTKTTVDPESINPSLALDVAQNLYDIPEILSRHDLTADQFRVILKNKRFRNLHREKLEEWNKESSAPERIRTKSLMAYESMGILTVMRIINDPEATHAIRLDAVKFLATSADIMPKKAASEHAAISGGFTLNISVPRPDGTFDRTIISE